MHTIDRGIKQNFCRWQGRLNRKRYIKRMLALWIPGSIICLAAFIAAAAAVLGGNADIAHLNEDQLRQLSYLLQGVSLVLLPFLIPSYMLMIRRLHDLGLSGYFALVSLIPLINLGLTLYLIFAEGTRGANAYGSDPLARDDATEEAAAAETAPARTEDAGSYAGLSLPPIFSKTGRLSRRDYALSIGVIWGGMNIASFAALILLLPLVWLFVNAFFRDTTILFLGFLIAALCMLLVLMYTALPLLAIPATVRRLHDFGHSGFFALPLMLVSLFVGGCVLFLMMIVLGSLGAKGYSPFGMPNESIALVVGTFSILLGLLAFPTGAILVFYTAWVFLKKGDPFPNDYGDVPTERPFSSIRAAFFSMKGTIGRREFILSTLFLFFFIGIAGPTAVQLVVQPMASLLVAVNVLPIGADHFVFLLGATLFPFAVLPLVVRRLHTLGRSAYEAIFPFAVLIPYILISIPITYMFVLLGSLDEGGLPGAALAPLLDTISGCENIFVIFSCICGIISLIGIMRLLAADPPHTDARP